MKLSGLKHAMRSWLMHRHRCFSLLLFLGFCLGSFPNLLLIQSSVAMQPETVLDQPIFPASMTPGETELRGNLAYQAGDYGLAAQLWRQAINGYEQQAKPAEQARSLSNLSLAYQALGQWPQAENAIARSLDLAQHQSPAIAAQALNTQGQLQLAVGKAQAALASWQQAEKAYGEIPDEAGLVRSQLNQIQALRNLGFYRRALDQMEQLEPKLSALPETSLKVAALTQVGELLRLAGDTQQAKVNLEEAVAMGDRLKQPHQTAQALMNLGGLAQTNRELQKALDYYDRTLELSLPPESRSQTQLAKLSLLLQQENLAAAQQLWPQLETNLGLLPANHRSIYQRINLAEQLITLKKLEQSSSAAQNKSLGKKSSKIPSWQTIETLLKTSLSQARSIQDQRAASYALGVLGEAYYAQERIEEAIVLSNKALQLAQQLSAEEIAYRWQWNISQMQMQQGHMDLALANCAEAVAMLQNLQSDLVALNPDVFFSFRKDIEPVYRGYVDILLQADRAANPAQALRQAQTITQSYLSQAQNAARGLRLSEMTNFLGADCLPNDEEQSISIGELDPTAAVVQPIVLKDRLEILLDLPDQSIQHYTVPVAQADVESLVKALRYYLVLRSRNRYLPLSQKLYDLLIRPLEPELGGIETLVFSPDGIFQGIPMAALHDGEQFLIERYQVAMSPSLELFESQPLENDNISVLAAGLSKARQGFSALPFVEDEINNIQQRITGTTALVDEHFTQEALRDRISKTKAPIVHIATHGQFGSRPEETFILAWDQSVNVRQIDQLLQSRNLSQQQAIELLVLSACETAAGDPQAMLGLAGLAIQAGARSALATLWSVNDAGTSALMENFYTALSHPETGRAQALRQAQLKMLEDPLYSHPLYWASYVMVGNWL